jgi:hypothetical protein
MNVISQKSLRLYRITPALKSGNMWLPTRVHGLQELGSTIFDSNRSHTYVECVGSHSGGDETGAYRRYVPNLSIMPGHMYAYICTMPPEREQGN